MAAPSSRSPRSAAPSSALGAKLPPPGAKDVLFIIDLPNYVFRAYHAIAPLSSSKGEPTHAVLGTVNMLQKVVNERRPNMLAVAMSYDPPSYVVNYTQTRKLPFEVAIDNTGSVAKQWGDVQLTPTTFLVNKRGEIVKRYVGEPNFVELHQLIEKLLAEG